MDSIGYFRNLFAENSGKLLVKDLPTKREFTYGQLENVSSQFANYLRRERDLKPGDRVALVLGNRTETLVSYLACLQSGLVAVPINPEFTGKEFERILKEARSNLVLTSVDYAGKLSGSGTDTLPMVTWGDESDAANPGVLRLSQFSGEPRWSAGAFDDLKAESLAQIMFTSGTTSQPKGVPIRAGRILGNGILFGRTQEISSDATFFNLLPLAYLGGWYNLFLIPTLAGGTVVLESPFGPSNMYSYWEIVRDHGINGVWYTPTILSMLTNIGVDDDINLKELAKQIRWSFVGMAPLPASVRETWIQRFGIPLAENYGLSETFFLSTDTRKIQAPPKSSGQILPGIEVKVSDAEGMSLPSGQIGEITVRSPYMIDEYLEAEATQASFKDGWFHTGDLGWVDADRNLYITGRKKDIIIRGGINLSPGEVEDVLYSHPSIEDAAVIGIPHTMYGEEVAAVVKLKSGVESLDAKEIVKFCKQHLAAIKVPRTIYFLTEFPRTPSGKIQKAVIRKIVEAKISPLA